MNIKTLNRDVRIDEETVVITENVETTLTKMQLEGILQGIQYEKDGIMNQNNMLIAKYEELTLQEAEYRDCLASLNVITNPKVIE